MEYDEFEHSHRFAGWAAARAAGASPKCRFRTEIGTELISISGLKEWGRGWETLPAPIDFDRRHREMRIEIVRLAKEKLPPGDRLNFTHGVAAKLINVYLKARFVVGASCRHPSNDADKLQQISTIHPPIDRLLLKQLEQKDVGGRKSLWRSFRVIGWSNFNSDQYEQVIDVVRDVTAGNLWTIESYWVGYR